MESLLTKYFAGEASADERAEVTTWRAASEENARLFMEYKQAWILSDPTVEAPEHILSAILDEPKTVTFNPVYTYLKYAAILLAVLGSTFFVYQFVTTSSDNASYVVTAEGESYLPDSTLIYLTAGSQLEVAFSEGTRDVKLQGKAYFDVKRDENKPFIITTKNSVVKVLGTSFVVDARSEVERVLVESGVVLFTAKGSKENKVELHKGEMAANSLAGDMKNEPISDINYLSWKSKKISFRKLPLSEVATVLKDVYDLDVVFSNPALKDCSLSADFNQKTKEEVAHFIATAFGFEYRLRKNELTLSGAACY